MIDADRLPLRRITRVRRHLKGGKPWYSRERETVVLLADLEAAKAEKPRTRMEQIQRMDVDELARRLLTLHDGDAGSYCRMKPECMAALEENRPETITDAHCLECVKAWLLAEI